MKSSKAKVDKVAQVQKLLLDLMSLTGYKIACVYANESEDSVCGYIVGDEKCFASLSHDQ